jgi:hypothetical protein
MLHSVGTASLQVERASAMFFLVVHANYQVVEVPIHGVCLKNIVAII